MLQYLLSSLLPVFVLINVLDTLLREYFQQRKQRKALSSLISYQKRDAFVCRLRFGITRNEYRQHCKTITRHILQGDLHA